MELFKLLIAFGILLVALLIFKRPLWQSALLGVVAACVAFAIPVKEVPVIIGKSLISSATVEVVAVIYLINVLQYILQTRGAIDRAEEALLKLINNRRWITVLSPIIFGLLPAPNSVVLSAPIVEKVSGEHLSREEMAYVSSYYRHIPESVLPLYPGLLLALGVTGLSASRFLLSMIPMTVVAVLFPYFFTIRPKVPAETGVSETGSKADALKTLFSSLWPILILVLLVVFFDCTTSICTLAICVILLFLYRFKPDEMKIMLKKAFHFNMIASMAVLMMFKDVISYTGIVNTLPEIFASLTLPAYIVYSLLMFVGGLVGLSSALIAVAVPMAMATIPNAGIPLLVLLMGFSHSAAQLSPMHLCLDIAVNHFGIEFRQLLKKTIPVTIVYCIISVFYYLLCVRFV